MNEQLAITIAQLAKMIIIIVAFIVIACLRERVRLVEFWASMIRQWRVATILTLIYLMALGISLTAFEIKVPPYLRFYCRKRRLYVLSRHAGTWIYR
jgi:hypothetical protein